MNYNWLGGIKWFYQAFAEFISTPMVWINWQGQHCVVCLEVRLEAPRGP